MNNFKFFSLAILYFAAVWPVLAYAPGISVAARLPMTWPLWLCVSGGFFGGACLANAFIFMVLGVRLLPYRQWDSSRETKVKTLLAKSIILLIMTAVGILGANLVVKWGLTHM